MMDEGASLSRLGHPDLYLLRATVARKDWGVLHWLFAGAPASATGRQDEGGKRAVAAISIAAPLAASWLCDSAVCSAAQHRLAAVHIRQLLSSASDRVQ